MPSRPQIHHGTSASPRHSSNAVNEVVNALQRKLTANLVDNISPSHSSSRRSSFSMENILHPKTNKKHDETKDREARQHKRMSLTARGSAKSKDRLTGGSPKVGPLIPGRFGMVVESPPLVLFGTPNHSTGALLSGRLQLFVDDPTGEITLNSFTMVLKAITTTRKPVGKDCRNCIEKNDEFKTWMFLSEPKTFHTGKGDEFPFSYLLPGHLPATTHSQMGSVSYVLVATATTSHDETIELVHPLLVQRAIPPGPDKSSIRIFPPTNLTGRAQLPPVVHPIGTFPVNFTLSGVVEKKNAAFHRWRLRKMMWRVEELSKVISTPCPKHQHKVSGGKAIQYSESKVLGNDEMKSGWKTDFDTTGGEILLQFDASVTTKPGQKVTCDVNSATGLEVRHNLVVELIIAEEYVPVKNPNLITPTGAARVLRMQFALIVTERAGMGISWDEEMPPMYEDVPASPPGYGIADKNDGEWGGAIMEDYNGPELEYLELERIQSDSPHDPPMYRDRPLAEIAHGFPVRSERHGSPQQGPSDHDINRRRFVGTWTEDELGAEPPQYALGRRRVSAESQETPEEDFGEGMTGNAPI